jgi:small-conductance mechanosensitive channel
VDGVLKAKEVKVQSDVWADFVFEKDYKLRSLNEVETFIQENRHLPDIPSEEEVKEEGISIGEMNARLLRKVEELTLYLIQQKKALEAEQERNEQLEGQQRQVMQLLQRQTEEIQQLKGLINPIN